jgi:hypothetical protein
MPQIEENVKYTLEETVTMLDLILAAMKLNNDDLEYIKHASFIFADFNGIPSEFLDLSVYPMSNNRATLKYYVEPDIPAFTMYTNKFVYFPCQNDMGVKWVSSVPCMPNYDISPKVIRV